MATDVRTRVRLQGAGQQNQRCFTCCRNINYTNRCTYACGFCAFSKGRIAEELRGAPYLLPYAEISRRTQEAWARGASETCMQGGIHPEFTGQPCWHICVAMESKVRKEGGLKLG